MLATRPLITRTLAGVGIAYGTTAFLILGFFSLTTLVLLVNPLLAALCLAAAIGFGLLFVTGGVLLLEGNSKGELWWMLGGGAAMIAWLFGDLTAKVALAPGAVGGVLAAVQRFGGPRPL